MNEMLMRISGGIVVFVIAASGVYLFFLNDGGERSYSKEVPLQQTIERRADGFAPQNVTIAKGGTVTFTSSIERHFWPASDLHPSHGTYAAFDPKRPIAPDASWSFTFDEVGEWGFHDHLAPSFGGTITVVSDGELVEEICGNERRKQECWRKTLFSLLESDGIDRVYDAVADLYEADEEFRSSCHSVAHDIGLEAYGYSLEDKDSILTPKASACAYGFYHGFMEGLLTSGKSVADARAFCQYVDARITPMAPDTTLQCYHGIGHGAVDLVIAEKGFGGNEERLIEEALHTCEEATKTYDELYRCTSGVYNSVANTYIEDSYLSINEEDPLRICRVQPESYKESCYGNMNSVVFWLADNTFAEAVSYIENMEEEEYRQRSMLYLSILATIYTILGEGPEEYQEAITVCRSLEGELPRRCVEGLVHGLLEHGAPEEEYEQAIDFCQSTVLNESERNQCFSYAIGNLNGWYNEEKAREACSTVAPAYRYYCEQ